MRKLIIFRRKLTDSFSDFVKPRKKYIIYGPYKKRKTCSLILISAGLLMGSCSHYYYVPGAQNVPLFREKDELHISGSYGEGLESKGINIQAAYSLTDNVGIMTDFISAKGGNLSNNNYARGNYFDVAAGYFKPLDKFGVFEIYGGLGRGEQHHEYGSFYYNQSTGYADLSFIKLYIQPSFGFTSDYFDIAFSTRISRITFNILDNNISGNTDSYNNLFTLSDKSHLFLEPGITLRAGWKSVKVQVQAVYSRYLNNPRLYIGEEYHLSLGLYFALGKKPK
jgi:hypothetical protein